jgi:hypothetical protein
LQIGGHDSQINSQGRRILPKTIDQLIASSRRGDQNCNIIFQRFTSEDSVFPETKISAVTWLAQVRRRKTRSMRVRESLITAR